MAVTRRAGAQRRTAVRPLTGVQGVGQANGVECPSGLATRPCGGTSLATPCKTPDPDADNTGLQHGCNVATLRR